MYCKQLQLSVVYVTHVIMEARKSLIPQYVCSSRCALPMILSHTYKVVVFKSPSCYSQVQLYISAEEHLWLEHIDSEIRFLPRQNVSFNLISVK